MSAPASRLRLVAMSAALTLARRAPEPLALVLATQATPARAFATMASSRYTVAVAATTAARGESRNSRRTAAARRFFYVRHAFARLLQGAGLGGGAFGLAGSYCRSLNPALCPPTPFESGERDRNCASRRHRMPQSSLAHTGQSPLPEILAIVRAALRDAVSAPTDRESLDLAGAALVAVADRVRALQAEVRHA